MKIVFLIPSLEAGGAERVITLLANYWVEKGYSIQIITLSDPNKSSFYPLSNSIQLLQTGTKKQLSGLRKLLSLGKQWNIIRREVNKSKPTALIAFLDISIFLSLILKPFINTKVIVSERNNPYLNETNLLLKETNDFLYKYTDKLVLQTEGIAKTYSQKLQNKIVIIPNPVVPLNSSLSNNSEPTKLPDANYIVAMGRLKYQKGFDVLIKAFAAVKEELTNWSLIIIGEGEERNYLQELCKLTNVDKKVHLIGRVKSPENILAYAKLFVLPSRFEGFPNALCEAMSMGLPCIATKCKFGPSEIITDQYNGLLVEVDQVESLSEKLVTLASSEAFRSKLGTEAKKITNTFAIQKIAGQWEEVINSK